MRCYVIVAWQPSAMLSSQARRISLAGLLLLSAGHVYADTAYITDSVTVGIFASADLKGEPLERLVSGTLVDVLQSQNGVAEVKSSSGRSGWLRTSFISSNLPASIKLENSKSELSKLNARFDAANDMIAKLQKEADALQEKAASTKDVGWMRGEMEKARDKAAKLEKQLQSKEAQVTKVGEQTQSFEEEVQTLRAENQGLKQRLAAAMMISSEVGVQQEQVPEASAVQSETAESSALGWSLLTMVLGLGFGFAAGYYWLDRRLRQRFCGVRVY